MAGDDSVAEWFRESYASSPDGPEHYDTIAAKILGLWRNPPQIPIDELAAIHVPVLLMQGDDDGVRVEYNRRLARALPDAELAVIPGTGHGAPMQKPALVNRMLLDFLAPERPERLIGMGALRDPD
jgi:pimeloyl-ACP methyl ester carboxylesterase